MNSDLKTYDISAFDRGIEGDPVKLGKLAGRLINQDYPGFKWHLTPVADHPRALSLHYLDNNTLCVAFFRKIECVEALQPRIVWLIQHPSRAYDTSPDSKTREKLWTIPAPDGTYMYVLLSLRICVDLLILVRCL